MPFLKVVLVTGHKEQLLMGEGQLKKRRCWQSLAFKRLLPTQGQWGPQTQTGKGAARA